MSALQVLILITINIRWGAETTYSPHLFKSKCTEVKLWLITSLVNIHQYVDDTVNYSSAPYYLAKTKKQLLRRRTLYPMWNIGIEMLQFKLASRPQGLCILQPLIQLCILHLIRVLKDNLRSPHYKLKLNLEVHLSKGLWS